MNVKKKKKKNSLQCKYLFDFALIFFHLSLIFFLCKSHSSFSQRNSNYYFFHSSFLFIRLQNYSRISHCYQLLRLYNSTFYKYINLINQRSNSIKSIDSYIHMTYLSRFISNTILEKKVPS